jgi:hypothetical protein
LSQKPVRLGARLPEFVVLQLQFDLVHLQFVDEPRCGLRIADCGLRSLLARLNTLFGTAAQLSGVCRRVRVLLHAANVLWGGFGVPIPWLSTRFRVATPSQADGWQVA